MITDNQDKQIVLNNKQTILKAMISPEKREERKTKWCNLRNADTDFAHWKIQNVNHKYEYISNIHSLFEVINILELDRDVYRKH